MASPEIAIVVAAAENGVIGADNDMPWHISSDLKRTKALTMGKPLVMGRATYQSIGRPLPGRDTIILTRDKGFSEPGCTVCHTLGGALDIARGYALRRGADEVIIFGGAQIYGQAMPFADRIYLTRVHANPEGTAYFPDPDPRTWKKVSDERAPRGPKDSAEHSVLVFEKSGAELT